MLKSLNITPRFIIFIFVFFSVCCIGCFLEPAFNMTDPSKFSKIQLTSIENDTPAYEFQMFYGPYPASALITANSTFKFSIQSSVPLDHPDHHLLIKCCKGSFLPVFIKYGGAASGDNLPGYDGPYYIAMWLSYPQVHENSKFNVRYYVKSGSVGKVGLKIGMQGDYRFIAHDNVQFLS